MRRTLFAALLLLTASIDVYAADLVWDPQSITAPLTIERSATETGTYATVATLPSGTTRYILTPGSYGWYRVRVGTIVSNVVQFSADIYTGLVTDRLTTLETGLTTLRARVTTLEAAPAVVPPPPAPTSNLTVRQIDADHIEISCNGISIATTGTGTRRTLECRH